MHMRNLSKEEKCRLVTGMGSWHTYDMHGQIPSIHLADGPHGVRSQKEGALNNNSKKATCFPTASAIACSFDRNLIQKVAKCLAQEALQDGVSILLGPGVNMKRSPLCGRNFEYYSEDPYLAGELAVAYIQTMQKNGVGTSIKHFAGNSQETRRHTQNSMIDERALHEIYLRAFQIAIQNTSPASVMAAYNRLNGEYCTQSKALLTNILREQWGYEGTVISDWGACNDLKKAIEAGMDLEMPDSHGAHIHKLIDNGDESAINRASNQVLRLIEKYPQREESRTKKYHHTQAIQASIASGVLLKNDGILPLNQNQKILVVGDMAKNVRYQGGGSSHVNRVQLMDCVTALQQEFSSVDYVQGYSFRKTDSQDQLISEACNQAKEYDVIVFYGGLSEYDEGEGFDRSFYQLEPQIISCLQALHKINPNIVYVSFSGSPYEIPFLNEIRAMLQMYLSGEGVSEAVSLLLSGKENPSGKLAESWPMKIEDVPSFQTYARNQNDIEYRESIFIGYRYYDTFHIPVQFPFGYGLSYTQFSMRRPRIFQENGRFYVTLEVENVGENTGACVVEVFVKNPKGNFIRANKELRGFEKVSLVPKEKKEPRILLDDHAFMVYDTKQGWTLVPGIYEIQICHSINQVACSVQIEIGGEAYENNQKDQFAEYFENPATVSSQTFAKLYGKQLPYTNNDTPGQFDMTSSLSAIAPYSFIFRMILWLGEHALPLIIYHGRHKDDPEIRMMVQGLKEGTADMICMQSRGVISHDWMERKIEKINRKYKK